MKKLLLIIGVISVLGLMVVISTSSLANPPPSPTYFAISKVTQTSTVVTSGTPTRTPTSAHTSTPIPSIYYVSTAGNDSNPGTIAQPWRTIQKAANTIVAGDRVYIRAGTYREQVKPKNSGDSYVGYITYEAYPNETVTIDGNSLTLGATDGLFWISRKNYIQVVGLRVVNAQGGYDTTGIRVDYSDHIVIAGNYTYNTTSSGIGVWASSNIVVDGNEIELANHSGAEENLSIARSYNVEVKNNNVHHSFNSPYGGEGINVKDGSYNVKVHHNQVHDSPKLAFGLDGQTEYSHDIEFYGNVAYNCAYGFIVESEQGGTVENIKVYNNIAYNNAGPGFLIPNWNKNNQSAKNNVLFINNTSYANAFGIKIWSTDIQNIVIRNNIISQNKSDPQIQILPGIESKIVIDHNLFDGIGASAGSNPVIGDPLFVNPARGDLHLQSDSPAIDAGSSMNSPATDFDGIARPQGAGYDIGAYEK